MGKGSSEGEEFETAGTACVGETGMSGRGSLPRAMPTAAAIVMQPHAQKECDIAHPPAEGTEPLAAIADGRFRAEVGSVKEPPEGSARVWAKPGIRVIHR